jgi:carbamoyltransferase
MAGGVALNCVANGRLLREGPFKSIWIQPAAGDAGGAAGAALGVWFEHLKNAREPEAPDMMQGCYLGPAFSNAEIKSFLDQHMIPYSQVDDSQLFAQIAGDLEQEKVIGWFSGRMEYGRAHSERAALSAMPAQKKCRSDEP